MSAMLRAKVNLSIKLSIRLVTLLVVLSASQTCDKVRPIRSGQQDQANRIRPIRTGFKSRLTP
jgi:hypothetical protein